MPVMCPPAVEQVLQSNFLSEPQTQSSTDIIFKTPSAFADSRLYRHLQSSR